MDLNQEIQNTLEVLQNGGIILYPTDTVWGIGLSNINVVGFSDKSIICHATSGTSLKIL